MHVLEAALFANLVSKERLPEAWRPVPERPQRPLRPVFAAAVSALTRIAGMVHDNGRPKSRVVARRIAAGSSTASSS